MAESKYDITRPVVVVAEGMRGFFCSLRMWNPEHGGFWEPEYSGFGSYSTPQEAVAEALAMAESENADCVYSGPIRRSAEEVEATIAYEAEEAEDDEPNVEDRVAIDTETRIDGEKISAYVGKVADALKEKGWTIKQSTPTTGDEEGADRWTK